MMTKDTRWVNLASNVSQEFLFDLWVEEAKEAGWIIQCIKHPTATILSEDVEHIEKKTTLIYKGTKREKKKHYEVKVTLLKGCTYGCDRLIQWAPKSEGIFFSNFDLWKGNPPQYFKAHLINENWWSYIDVKSPFKNKNTSDISFSIKRKWAYQKYKQYINKAVMYPIKKVKNKSEYLWPSTFTPARYFWTDKMTALRTISKWKAKRLQSFAK